MEGALYKLYSKTRVNFGAGMNTYQGCFKDGSGPYNTFPWGSTRTLPAALNTDGFTIEQCARAAALRGFEVFAIQATGYCFMGTLEDVARMTQRLDDGSCSNIPCVGDGNCDGWINKVYSIGAHSLFLVYTITMNCVYKSERGGNRERGREREREMGQRHTDRERWQDREGLKSQKR
jgi:hypothetical protein